MEKEATLEEFESVLLGVSLPSGDHTVDLGRLCNALSLLHETLGKQSWVGIYLDHNDTLVLGPFQGTPACETIMSGFGVVGTCFDSKRPVPIQDVRLISNYICCDASARSEICVPLRHEDTVFGVLDIDLPVVHDFANEIDFYQRFADKIANLIH